MDSAAAGPKAWRTLLRADISDFIKTHDTDDVRKLSLKKPPHPDWPYPLIMDQIKARQKAQVKIPDWLSHDQIVFPSSDILEQASSAATALYKSSLVQGRSIADLTGGAGVDLWGFLTGGSFKDATCVEQYPAAADLLAHNMNILTDNACHVVQTRAEDYVQDMRPVDVVYIDPARRDQRRKGLFLLADTSPNVLDLLPVLNTKSGVVMVKTAPMLDIDRALQDLPQSKHVHVVQWRGECREVLYVLDWAKLLPAQDIPITVVDVDDIGQPVHTLTFTRRDEQSTVCSYGLPQKYLYEPGPAFQKAGAYKVMAQRYNVQKLHPSTHLYTSSEKISDFPGRVFEIAHVYPVQRKALPINKANLTVRNFPSTVADLRKKLKLKEGGADFLFACTLHDDRKVLIHGRKI